MTDREVLQAAIMIEIAREIATLLGTAARGPRLAALADQLERELQKERDNAPDRT